MVAAGMKASRYRMPADAAHNTYGSFHTTVLRPSRPVPAICHGLAGAEILLGEGLPRHARVAERHTGTGITRQAIEQQGLPLPADDYTPQTMEEQVICYADKFFSKSHPEHEKTLEEAIRSLWKFGPECTDKMMQWNKMFG